MVTLYTPKAFRMKKRLFFFALSMIASLSRTHAGGYPSVTVSDPKSACEKIHQVYSQCAKPIDSHFAVHAPEGDKQLLCHDGQNLEFYKRMENMDVASMLAIPYRTGRVKLPVQEINNDPGRLRNEAFFKAIYGNDETEVKKNLVEVEFLGQKAIFNRKNGAAQALKKVGADLTAALQTDTELKTWLQPWLNKKLLLNDPETGDTATFLWRNIKGTTRLSNHSFGTAIDLYDSRVTEPYYWLWEEADRRVQLAAAEGRTVSRSEILKTLKEKDVGPYHPEKIVVVPQSLVDAFENHGFIWGGKWNHFDAMHFEYRPEFFYNLPIDCTLE